MQLGFHVEQLLGFRLGELEDRDTRRAGHDLGDDLLVHFHLHVGFAFAPRGFLLFALGFQLLLAVTQFCGLLEVLLLDGFVLLGRHLGDLRVKILELGWGSQALDPQPRTGLVDKIDRLVRQVTVLDVACGQFGGGLQRAIGDGHVMMVLIPRTQTLENLDCLGNRRLMDLNRLETAFQRRVLFDVLAVFLGRGRANGL